MKISRFHILVVLSAAMILFSSCRRNEAEVIPRGKLAKIYAEMFVTDQWIVSNQSVRRIADTSLVYEPILEKYGYDTEDYLKSVDKYMDDPERFSRILRTTVEILDARIKELEEEQARILAKSKLPVIKVEFNMEELSKYMTTEPYVHYFDSLDVVLDSATLLYNLLSIERADTLYDGLKMVIKGTDSLDVADSVRAPEKEILKIDSLKVDSKEIRRPKLEGKKSLIPVRKDSVKRLELR